MMNAIRQNWMLIILYIKRWLTVPYRRSDGGIINRNIWEYRKGHRSILSNLFCTIPLINSPGGYSTACCSSIYESTKKLRWF